MVTLENEKDQLESDLNQYMINNRDSPKVRVKTLGYYQDRLNEVNLFISNGNE